MAEPIFTAHRRDLVARTLLDLLKIAVGAAFASKLFVDFSRPVKIGLVSAMVMLALMGFLICPKKPANKE